MTKCVFSVDIDECGMAAADVTNSCEMSCTDSSGTTAINDGTCDHSALCTNNNGGHTCIGCPTGYEDDGNGGCKGTIK